MQQLKINGNKEKKTNFTKFHKEIKICAKYGKVVEFLTEQIILCPILDDFTTFANWEREDKKNNSEDETTKKPALRAIRKNVTTTLHRDVLLILMQKKVANVTVLYFGRSNKCGRRIFNWFINTGLLAALLIGKYWFNFIFKHFIVQFSGCTIVLNPNPPLNCLIKSFRSWKFDDAN